MMNPRKNDFDVCIAGSGLPECMIAAGLSVRGYKVLLVDKSPIYGGVWGSLSLKQFCCWSNSLDVELSADGCFDDISEDDLDSVEWTSLCSSTPFSLDRFVQPRLTDSAAGNIISTKRIEQDGNGKMSINATKREEFSPALFHHKRSEFSPFNLSKESEVKQDLMRLSNRFSLDLLPRMIYSHSQETEIIIKSGVCRYLEFKGVENPLVLLPNACSGGEYALANIFPTPLHFDVPPLSKSAIFQNKSLSLKEKRSLMKFITTCGLMAPDNKQPKVPDDVATALHRPTESRVTGPVSSARALSAFLSPASLYSVTIKTGESMMWSEMMKDLSLGLRLRLTYGLCLKPDLEYSDVAEGSSLAKGNDWDAAWGLKQLHNFTSSFGRFSEGSFIYPNFGTGDIPQAFARLSAVYRGVFMLRTGIEELFLGPDGSPSEDKNVDDSELPSPPPLPSSEIDGVSLQGIRLMSGKTIRVKKLICSLDQLSSAISSAPAKQKGRTEVVLDDSVTSSVSRLVAVVDTPLFDSKRTGPQFAVVVLLHDNPVQILQVDHTSGSCPEGFALIYMAQKRTSTPKSVSTEMDASKEALNSNSEQEAARFLKDVLHYLLEHHEEQSTSKIPSCLFLTTFTQTNRITKLTRSIDGNVFLLPDSPSPEYLFTMRDEVPEVTKVLSALMNQQLEPTNIVPMPLHVDKERREELKQYEATPYEQLAGMAQAESQAEGNLGSATE